MLKLKISSSKDSVKKYKGKLISYCRTTNLVSPKLGSKSHFEPWLMRITALNSQKKKKKKLENFSIPYSWPPLWTKEEPYGEMKDIYFIFSISSPTCVIYVCVCVCVFWWQLFWQVWCDVLLWFRFECWASFHVPISHLHFLFGKIPIQVFPVFNWVVWFFWC